MKIGICTEPILALTWSTIPGDYIEANVQNLLIPESPEGDFSQVREQIKPLEGQISAANCFIPGDLKVVGPNVDHDRLARYAGVAFCRAASIGIKTIVFGSGGARQIPDGWSHADAFLQFIKALEICAPLAQEHGVILVVEPLNTAECNLINTVIEGAVAVARVNHPNIRLLVDIYHMLRNGEPAEDIVKVGPWITHAHVAEKEHRTAPGIHGDDFTPYLNALHHASYTGDISIECIFGPEPHTESHTGIAKLKAQLAALK